MAEHGKRIAAGSVAVFLPLLSLLLFLSRDYCICLARFFPECHFFKQTGFLCPACGNTRSVTALLHGNIITSIGYNVTPFLLAVFAAAFYIELVFRAFGVTLCIIPRSYWFLTAVLTGLILYFILRNFVPVLTLCI